MPAQFVALVMQYGYVATLIGTLLEGETVLVLSGVAASRGYLELPQLFAVGAMGAVLTDNFFFALGRVFGPALLERFPRLAPSIGRVHLVVERFPRTAVIALRFLYGMRSVGPAVVGSGGIAWSRFFLLDLLAAAAWSVCWISAGYLLGGAVEESLRDMVGVGRWLLAAVVVAVAIVTLMLHRARRMTRAPHSKYDKPRW